jgi:hypothetical protein
MTIASCLVLPEGVIFGVDSTASTDLTYGYHYLNHNQKLFQVGEDSTFGILTWGLSYFRETSYRTLIGYLSDEFREAFPSSVFDAANRWMLKAWAAYQEAFKDEIAEFRELERKQQESAQKLSDNRSDEDDKRYLELKNEIVVGFCLGGYCPPNRTPQAFSFEFDPTLRSPPTPKPVIGELFEGQPKFVKRIDEGIDLNLREKIAKSPFWTGKKEDLDEILFPEKLERVEMPIRDGIDFVHFNIYATIKAMKFSTQGQVCGGPIEIAVITTDRKFRWVRHKPWDSAIGPEP